MIREKLSMARDDERNMIREKLSMARDEVRWLMTTATIMLVALAGSLLVVLVEIPYLVNGSSKKAKE